MAEDPRERPPPMPTWVKAFIAVGFALCILAVLALVLAPGEHGPRRHAGGTSHPPSENETRAAAVPALTGRFPPAAPSGSNAH